MTLQNVWHKINNYRRQICSNIQRSCKANAQSEILRKEAKLSIVPTNPQIQIMRTNRCAEISKRGHCQNRSVIRVFPARPR